MSFFSNKIESITKNKMHREYSCSENKIEEYKLKSEPWISNIVNTIKQRILDSAEQRRIIYNEIENEFFGMKFKDKNSPHYIDHWEFIAVLNAEKSIFEYRNDIEFGYSETHIYCGFEFNDFSMLKYVIEQVVVRLAEDDIVPVKGFPYIRVSCRKSGHQPIDIKKEIMDLEKWYKKNKESGAIYSEKDVSLSFAYFIKD